MPFSNTMVPSRSSPRIANAFFALLHDSHAKRPARCERLRCLHRPLRDASSRQQSPEIPATMQHLFRAVFESSDSASRVRQILPPPSHGTRRGRSAPSGWRPPVALQYESSTVPLRENTSFLHGPKSPSQPPCLRKDTVRRRQLKERRVNETATEGFSHTSPPRPWSWPSQAASLPPGDSLQQPRILAPSHDNPAWCPRISSNLRCRSTTGFPFPPETFWKIRLKICRDPDHVAGWKHETPAQQCLQKKQIRTQKKLLRMSP